MAKHYDFITYYKELEDKLNRLIAKNQKGVESSNDKVMLAHYKVQLKTLNYER